MKKLLLSSLIITSVFALAYTQTDVANANYLATKGIITQQSTAAGYRLDDTITRAEVAGIALKLRGTILPEGYTCKRYFGDTLRNDWICRAVELAADAGLISRTNTKFRPQDKITKVEALAIMMKAGGIKIQEIGVAEYLAYFDSNGIYAENWQSNVLETARQLGLITPAFKESVGGTANFQFAVFDYYWKHNDNATRGEVFKFAKNILEYQATMSGEVIVSNNGSSNTGLSSEIIIENGNLILYENGSRIRQITFDGKADNSCGTGHNAQYTYVGKSGGIYLYDKRIYATCDSATSMRKIGVLNGIVFDIGEKIQNKYGIDLLMFPSSALYVVNDGQEKIIGFFSYDSSEFRQNIDTKLFIPIEKIQQIGIIVTQEPVASDGSIFGRGRPGKFELLINLKQILQ